MIILERWGRSAKIAVNRAPLSEWLKKKNNNPKLLPFSDKYKKNGCIRTIKMFKVKNKKTEI